MTKTWVAMGRHPGPGILEANRDRLINVSAATMPTAVKDRVIDRLCESLETGNWPEDFAEKELGSLLDMATDWRLQPLSTILDGEQHE